MPYLARILLLCAALAAGSGTAWAKGRATKITFYGHAAFQITTPRGKVLFVDPWLKNPLNPNAKNNHDPVDDIHKADYILLTHGHFDHVGDAVELGKKTGARLVTNYELGANMAKLMGYPKDQMGFDTLFNIGGEISIADGEVTVFMTPAIHSSGMNNPKAGPDQPDIVYGGTAAGFVIKIKNGPTIYDTGDTAYFSDMKLIGRQWSPDIALVNIGGHFGMEPDRAVAAVAAVHPHYAIPQHYGTFPVLNQSPASFVQGVKKYHITPMVMNPGETLTYTDGKLTR